MFSSRCPACGRTFVEPKWRWASTWWPGCHCPRCEAPLRLSPAAERRMLLPGVAALPFAAVSHWGPAEWHEVSSGLGFLALLMAILYVYSRREYCLAADA